MKTDVFYTPIDVQAEHSHSLMNNEAGERRELELLKRIKAETEQALHFGTFEYNFTNDVATWSDGVYKLFGYKEERPLINYEKFVGHFNPNNKEQAIDILNRVIRDDKEYCVQYDIITVDNLSRRIEVIGKKELNEDGVPFKNSGIIRDITTQYEQEQTISKVIGELQRSNKELEEFAYVASHDLQEPLRKVTTFADMLKSRLSGKLQDDATVYLERIGIAADNMRVLIDNLLDFSRISTANGTFLKTNLNSLFQEVRTDLDLIIEETGTVINKKELPQIEVIPSQMKQLFNNIIGNAIKFRKKDVIPVIDITSSLASSKEKAEWHLSGAVNYFKIEICDNGIGFDNQYASRIFQIFQRLHGKSEYPGSGIGLAICKKIIDQHHGVIYANNIESRGACFTIILPEVQAG